MKAKRLLSAFLAVAMMLTTLVALGTVTYAAIEGAENLRPSLEVKFVKMTAEEMAEVAETTGVDAVNGTGYWVIGILDGYGTLSSKATGAGTKLNEISVQITFGDGVANCFAMGEESAIADNWWITDYGDTGAAGAYKMDDTTMTVSFVGTTGKACYPTGAVASLTSEGDDGETITVWKLPLIATKDNFTGTLKNSSMVISIFTSDKKVTTSSNWAATSETQTNYTVTKSFTIGSSTPVVNDPVINDVVANGTDGVAIIGQDTVKYDNALSVTASFENVSSITGAGVLFIPSTVLGDNTLTAETANVANAYKIGAGGGDGTLTIKAAIKDIPRALQGTDIQFVTRPYILKDTTYTYGKQATTTVNFGNTGEIAD